MGGFLSALSGFGQAAGPYREHVLDRWTQTKHNIVSAALPELANIRDPATRLNALKSIMGIEKAVPGTDLSGPVQSLFESINIHPNTHQMMVDNGVVAKSPSAPETKPAAPPPGMTPGTGLGQTLAPSKEGSAAQPAANPVQSGGGPINLPHTIGIQANPATVAPINIPSVQASAMPATPQPAAPIVIPPVHPPTPEEIDALEGGAFHRQQAAGYVTPAEDLAHQHFQAGHAALAEKKAETRYKLEELGPQQRAALRQAIPNFDQMPGWMQGAYAAQTIGLQPVNMPMAAFNQQLVSTITAKDNLPPNTILHGDAPYYRLERSPMDGSIHAYPTEFRPEITPHAMPTGAGGQTFITPAEAKAGGTGTAILGVVAPSMLGTERSTSTRQLPEGGSVSTVESHKIAPVGAGGATATKPAATEPRPKGLPQVTRPFNPEDRTDSIVAAIGRDANNWKMATNAADKYKIGKRMAELGIDPNNVTGSMRERAGNARLVLGHLDDVNRIIDEADKAGEIGIVASRWNDFLSGKLGVDPTPDQVFTKLSSNLAFLSTAVAMAHGGLRGGGSPQMVEHWERALFAKDAATLRQKLAQAHKWMEGYASLVPQKPEGTGTTQIQPVGVPEVGSTFAGGKVLSVKRVD